MVHLQWLSGSGDRRATSETTCKRFDWVARQAALLRGGEKSAAFDFLVLNLSALQLYRFTLNFNSVNVLHDRYRVHADIRTLYFHHIIPAVLPFSCMLTTVSID